MKIKNIKQMVLLAAAAAIYAGCNTQWDDHVKVNDQNLQGSVLEAIQKNKDLSTFYGFIQETGYSSVLNGANNYTVLAPVNSALESYTNSDQTIKKSIVRNHIAFLTQNAEDLKGTVKMINGKNLDIDDVSLSQEEILCGNGILRVASNVVLPKNNIYEFINSYKDKNMMADIIINAGDSIMDQDKSIQLGVDKETGMPYYDTVWLYYNRFLDVINIDDEDADFKMIMLNDENFLKLRGKYAKYMAQLDDDADGTKTKQVAAESLICDLVCDKSQSEYVAVTGVKVDMSAATISQQYDASNGVFLIADDVNIKIKDNKIKDVIIQGEDYVGCLESNWVYTRLRDEAVGGRDIMLSGYSTPSSTVTVKDQSGQDSTYTISYKFIYGGTSGTNYSRTVNSYVRYTAKLYSVKYNVFWVANDDIPEHYAGDKNDPDYDPEQPNKPCTSIYRVKQKLFIGEEGKKLAWNSSVISNFKKSGSNGIVMVGIDPDMVDERTPDAGVNAGVLQVEQPLRWHMAKAPYYPVGNPLSSASTRDVLSITKACDIDLMVTNSVSSDAASNQVNGFIFLDYIRFSPIIDDED